MRPDHLLYAALGIVSLSLFITFIRVIRGPSVPDRVVAVDLIGASTVGLLVLGAAASKETAFLDAATVIALLGFLGTIAYARYVQKENQE